ncbi:hypothetical protein ACWXWK_24180, partial [Pantoea ananatis]
VCLLSLFIYLFIYNNMGAYGKTQKLLPNQKKYNKHFTKKLKNREKDIRKKLLHICEEKKKM